MAATQSSVSTSATTVGPVGHQPGTPENPLHTILTVPNVITLCRLFLTIVFLVLYPISELRTPAIVIFIIAASTDWLDGQVARRTHQVSVFGKRFDPVMDRVLIFSGVLALFIARLIPVWVAVFLVARDVYLAVGGLILRRARGIFIDVAYVGKAATFVLMSGFAVLLLGLFPVPGLGLVESAALPGWGSQEASLGIWGIYVGVALSFITAIVYTVRGARALMAASRP
ncbi:MAG: CDP-alcohol phosphatidyltransferase family protein [Coriobacteriia bacterium]|nr:CDP-alcohol phosphatidyltransferase family protein [Coriobacteriia bacterium]